MPPADSVWAQYPLVAVIVLCIGALGLGARRFWKEFTDWSDRQDVKRETEREKQRDWQERLLVKQEEINEKRETRWQEIYKQMFTEVTNELKCLRSDLGDHHQVALGIKAHLEQQTKPVAGRKRVE
jgi:hypothetical protein